MIYLTLIWVFFRLGFFTIGGGYAMLPLIQAEVEQRGWITAAEFVDMLAIAEMTPGPVGVNVATFVGYRLAGVLGGILATVAVTLPALIFVLLISKALDRFRDHPTVEAILRGIRPVVAGLIISAAVFVTQAAIVVSDGPNQSMGRLDPIAVVMCAIAIVAVAKYRLHPIGAIVGAALLGMLVF
ncbi:MAG: chromate transporter [Firmicutes bacterium]|nr:chromate transporter [Bacillota bacterium]